MSKKSSSSSSRSKFEAKIEPVKIDSWYVSRFIPKRSQSSLGTESTNRDLNLRKRQNVVFAKPIANVSGVGFNLDSSAHSSMLPRDCGVYIVFPRRRIMLEEMEEGIVVIWSMDNCQACAQEMSKLVP